MNLDTTASTCGRALCNRARIKHVSNDGAAERNAAQRTRISQSQIRGTEAVSLSDDYSVLVFRVFILQTGAPWIV